MTIDELANLIRTLDGNHDLGAGALAEALMPYIHESETQAVAEALRQTKNTIQLPGRRHPNGGCY